MSQSKSDFRIGLVGPCGSGKSSLAAGLQKHSFKTRHIAQEHSYVLEMWQIISQPDFLIYLSASYQQCTQRKNLNWRLDEYAEQLRRLEHAKENCDLYIDTDDLSVEDVLRISLEAIGSHSSAPK